MAKFKDCALCKAPRRHPGCHATCERYVDARREHDKAKEQERKEKAFDGYTTAAYERMVRTGSKRSRQR